MRFAPVLKALLLAAAAFGLARALFIHDGVGVLEWLVGVPLVGTLSIGAAHFARQSLLAE